MKDEPSHDEQRRERTPGDEPIEGGADRPDAGQIDEEGAILGGATISGDGPTS